jgi:hypothetical protein
VKTFYLLVGNPGENVGVYRTRQRARNDKAISARCCALFTISRDNAALMLKRKRCPDRGIHTVRFVVEPTMRRLS